MCATKNCRKIAKRGNYCYSCVIRKFAAKHPEKYAYFTLRNNARRRGKEFSITFADFLEAITPTKYMKRKGRTATSLHIDRDKEWLGYVPGNIGVKKNRDNIRKFLTWQHDEKGKPTHYKFVTTTTQTDENENSYPF